MISVSEWVLSPSLSSENELEETKLSKEEFKTWTKQYLGGVAQRLEEEKPNDVGLFKENATHLARFILDNFEEIKIYS